LNRLKLALASLFIAAEVGIYAAFNTYAALELPDPIYLKYSGVLFCVLFAGAFAALTRTVDSFLVFLALIFTAVSDLFILVLGANYEVGLATFIVAQTLYFVRLYFKRRKKLWVSLVARVTVFAILALTLSLLFGADLLITECCLYIVMLVANLVDALIICRRGKACAAFAIGLFLFLCCDICVGLHNFGNVLGIVLPQAVLRFAADGMWAFYLPSQVIIVLTAYFGLNFGSEVKNEKTNKTV